MTAVPRLCDNFCATRRVVTSVAPPAARPTIILMGWPPKSCARTDAAVSINVATVSANHAALSLYRIVSTPLVWFCSFRPQFSSCRYELFIRETVHCAAFEQQGETQVNL